MRTLLLWAVTLGAVGYVLGMVWHHLTRGHWIRKFATGSRWPSMSFWFLIAVCAAVVVKVWWF